MIAPARTPADTYRTVDFDARVIGASPADLTDLCYEQLIAALASAIHAHRHSDPLETEVEGEDGGGRLA